MRHGTATAHPAIPTQNATTPHHTRPSAASCAPTWAMAPEMPPDIARSLSRTLSGSCATMLRIESFSVNLSAVSGAIFTTFAPLPLKKDLMEPGGLQ